MDTIPAPEQKKTSKLWTEYYGTVFFFAALAFIVAAGSVVKPKLDELKRSNAQIVGSLETLENERRYLNSLEQSVAAAGSISSEMLDQVDRALPRRKGIPELLVLFENTAVRDGVKISSLTFAEQEPAARVTSTVGELSVALSVSAKNYPQIKKFIRDLEVSLRLLDITGINVSTRGEESGYAIQLKTYTYNPVRRAVTPAQR